MPLSITTRPVEAGNSPSLSVLSSRSFSWVPTTTLRLRPGENWRLVSCVRVEPRLPRRQAAASLIGVIACCRIRPTLQPYPSTLTKP